MMVVVQLFGKLEARIQIRTIFGEGGLCIQKFLENNTVYILYVVSLSNCTRKKNAKRPCYLNLST